jgi:transaldolase
MKATQELHDIGQSLWLDNITRALLKSGTLSKYIDELSVTGLTSNPTIFDHAMSKSNDYNDGIKKYLQLGKSGEELFFELAIEDLQKAADLFKPTYDKTCGVDGWVSLEVSPLLAYDSDKTLAAAKSLHQKAARPNLFIKIPGTREGITAIEEAIFAGVHVNVTLLFSAAQYKAAADAYTRGIERRINAGLKPDVSSVASIFISRWDVAVKDKVPANLRNKLGIAVAGQTYQAYLDYLASPSCQKLENMGARPQRLLWASTGTKDPDASDVLYVQSLASPLTVNTMPEDTLKAFADHGKLNEPVTAALTNWREQLEHLEQAGIKVDVLGEQLQSEGANSFDKSWKELMTAIATKSSDLKAAH